MRTFSRLPKVLERFPYSRSTLYEKMKRGEFPKPVKLGGPDSRAVAWDDSELDAHAEQLIAERETA